MGIWDAYQARLNVNGETKRERLLAHTQDNISRKITDSLSCHDVLINGVKQTITITNKRDDPNLKNICALPGESLVHGGIVDFANSKWLIIEVDANDEVYSTGQMRRCNYLLKWLNTTGSIIEKWCVVEDGSSALIGEKASDIMAIGDARLAITIAKDADTIEIGRGKRFLIDDPDAKNVLAYQITKSDRLYSIYNGVGVYRYILNEVNVTDNDNKDLLIADYYNHTSVINQKTNTQENITILSEEVHSNSDANKGVWI